MTAQKVISTKNQSGFTLVELLVVIGIIALLIGILLPALGRARQIAKDTLCASNMRQVTLALMIYANGNNARLPQAETAASGGIPWHVQIWQTVMRTPFSLSDITGGGNYSYMAHTPFECPTADQSKSITPSVPPWYNVDGYDNSDHRNNGYALNIDLPGTIANSWTTPASTEAPQIVESKLLNAVRHPSEAMLLADSKAYYIEYYDRGDSLLYMDAGFGDGGGMHRAWGRHGRWRDAWNVAFCDGSVRMLRFADLPGIPTTPTDYYLVSLRLNPSQLLGHADVPSVTKRFWLGRDQ
jgi:prepilin-type N-terminal cleavage/methylation domain-containing protein/prepilin-type processing-associated H-X9-DG protein